MDADEAADLVSRAKVLEIVSEREIGEPVAVVREKDVVVGKVTLHRLEALPDVGVQAGISERDLPVVDVTAVQPNVFSAGELEVVRQALVVVQEILLDEITAIAETEDELGVAEVR